MSRRNRLRRARLFIDPMVQGAIVRRLMLYWALVFAVIFVFVTVMHVLLDGVDKPFSLHALEIWQTYGLLFVCLACLVPIFAYDAVKMSHRFAGPMVSLRRALEQLADGKDIEPLRFRRSDYWHALTDATNRVAARMRELRGVAPAADSVEEAEASESTVS